MFRPTSAQLSMLESQFLLPPVKRKRLEESWAEDFRTRVLPLIDESAFKDDFCDDNGRPNRSIRLLVGLHILKEMFDLTDSEVLDNLEFNLQWQHALSVTVDEAHLCQKTLHNFRVRLAKSGRATRLFNQVVVAMVDQEKIAINRQRLDSTHVRSNIATLTRLSLFVETITSFLREVRKRAPAKLEPIHPAFVAQYLDRDGYFSDVKRDEARRRLPLVAQHVADVVGYFKDDAEITTWPEFGTLARLLREQCEPAKPETPSDASVPRPEGDPPGPPPEGGPPLPGAPPVVPKAPTDISGSSLQSPHDPDATYGHKGKGYSAQLAETCSAENPFQLVTFFLLTGANRSDQHAVREVIQDLNEKSMKPATIFADAGYGSGANILEALDAGVDLHAPVRDPSNLPKVSGLVPMTMRGAPSDEAPATDGLLATEVAGAPDGGTPPPSSGSADPEKLEDMASKNENAAIGFADEAAPQAPQTKKDARAAATKERQRVQRTPAFKDAYKIRSGIESTNAELKGRHGGAGFRVRGQRRMEVALALKLLALNTSRLVDHHRHRRREAARGPAGARR